MALSISGRSALDSGASRAAREPSPRAGAAPFLGLPQRVLCVCNGRHSQRCRQSRRVIGVAGATGPQQSWRTQPATSTLPPPRLVSQPQPSGPPPLVWLVGCVLVATAGFNLLRALVLAWVSRQPRSSVTSGRVSSGSSNGGSGAGGSSYDPQQQQQPQAQRPRQQQPQQGMTVDVELEPAGSGLAAAAGAAAAVAKEGLANAERVASGAAAGPGPGSSSTGSSGSAAAVAGTAATDSPSSGGPGGPQEQGQQPVVQMASYQLRGRGRQATTNLGRVVICAVLAPPAAAAPTPASAGAGADSGGSSSVGVGAKEAAADAAHEPGVAAADAAADAGSAATATTGTGGGAAGAGGVAGAAPWRSPDWHALFWKPLFTKYGAGAGDDGAAGAGAGGGASSSSEGDRVTGLLVHYGDCVMHVLEGDNNLLFALLRELRPSDVAVHGLAEIRVPCYILDLQERLFDSWQAAAVAPPSLRRRLTRASLESAVRGKDGGGLGGLRGAGMGTGMGVGMPGGRGESRLQGPADAVFGEGGGVFGDEEEDGLDMDPDAVAAAEQEAAAQQLVARIQQVELFIKFVGPKLSAPASQTAQTQQALSNLADFETTTPPRTVVAALATDEMAPALPDFIDAYDADYRRYLSLLALVEQRREEAASLAASPAGGPRGSGGDKEAARAMLAGLGGLLSDIRHLGRYYDGHVTRDLQEALAERAEARRQSGSDEVVKRLAQGMRLKVQQ